MKKIWKCIVPFLLVICFAAGSMDVRAADELLGTVVDGSLLTDKTEVENIVYPKLRGSYLSSGSGHLTIAAYGKVTMNGSTSAYQTVDSIKVTLYLQRLQSGSWTHVATLGPRTVTNSYYVSNIKTYSVAHGYYYRVYGVHTTIKGSTVESVTSYTDGLWVP